jgi:DNA repair protein RecO (recombination protein O)
MPLERDQALCLRLVPYSETSLIVSLLTREFGLLRLLAKGAYRRTRVGASKFDGGLDLLDLGEAVFTGGSERSLGLLTEWKLLDGHLALRRGGRTIFLGQLIAELLPLLFEEHDPHPQVFDRALATIRALGGETQEEAMVAFLLDLLRESGYAPELTQCTVCGKPPTGDRVHFSLARGGIVCGRCEDLAPDRQPVEASLLRLADAIARQPREDGVASALPRLARAQSDPLNRLLLEHLSHTLQRPIATGRYVVPSRRPGPTTPQRR